MCDSDTSVLFWVVFAIVKIIGSWILQSKANNKLLKLPKEQILAYFFNRKSFMKLISQSPEN